ncbi:MAG: tRNA lysidine(34) synthetase TilS [Gemmatimonadales bacterium]
MSDLPIRFRTALDRLGISDGTVVLAVSGGPDSMALMSLASEAAPQLGLTLTVAHFDHGIAAESALVAERVRRAAEQAGLPFISTRTELGADASETEARLARLAWLDGVARDTDATWILTAHHRDDQAETVLMRVLEGSGPAGLSGIPSQRGRWARPLLEFGRAELGALAADRGLDVWDDPSNRDPRHYRSWLRGAVLPMLRQRLPDVDAKLVRVARAAAEDREAWNALLDELPGLDLRPEQGGASVAVAPLSGYSSAIVRGVLRALGARFRLGIGRREVDRMQILIGQGSSGQAVDLRGGAVAQLDFDRLRLCRPAGHPGSYDTPLPLAGQHVTVPGWRFEVSADPPPDQIRREGWTTWVPWSAELRIRPWMVGDRIRPLGGAGSRLVVRCMQDRKISRHRRPGWPVLVRGDEVVWVPGVCRSEAELPLRQDVVRIDARSS